MSKLTYTQDDLAIIIDTEQYTANQMAHAMSNIMKAAGYHPVSVWRALNNAADAELEQLRSVVDSQDEFDPTPDRMYTNDDDDYYEPRTSDIDVKPERDSDLGH